MKHCMSGLNIYKGHSCFTLSLPARTSHAFQYRMYVCNDFSTVSLFRGPLGKSEKQLFYSSTPLFLFCPQLSPVSFSPPGIRDSFLNHFN